MRSSQSPARRDRWDEVDGRRVHSVEAGVGHTAAEPVVVVPGLGALGYLFDTVDRCGDRARTFLLDVPGFGHRRPRPSPAAVPDLGRLVAGWLDTVPDGPAVLVGHSTGAQVALRAAVANQDRVRALVLIGLTIPPPQRRLSSLVGAFVRNSRHEPPGQIPVTWPYYLRGGPRELARYVRSALHDEPERHLRRVTCPVLLVRGEHDAFAPRRWLDQLAAVAPHARTVTAPGAHAFPYQHGAFTAELITGAARHAELE